MPQAHHCPAHPTAGTGVTGQVSENTEGAGMKADLVQAKQQPIASRHAGHDESIPDPEITEQAFKQL